MMYNAMVEEYFFHPQHVGELPIDERTIQLRSGQPGLTEVVALSLNYDAGHTILNMRFKAQGSPYLIASAEWLCRTLEGKAVTALESIDENEMIKALSIPKSNEASAMRLKSLCNGLYLKCRLGPGPTS